VDTRRLQLVLDGLQRVSVSLEHARSVALHAADIWQDISYVWGGFDRCSWVGQEGWPGRSSWVVVGLGGRWVSVVGWVG
jgi:hypothetical protein